MTRRLCVGAEVGAPVTGDLLTAYRSLLYFSVTVLDRDLRELRQRGLVAHARARSAWPLPLCRATDRVTPQPLRHLS